jgi:signal transduction histidine kinase
VPAWSRRGVGLARARRLLVDEHAALRRVGDLVAREAAPQAVLAAIAEELGRLLGADIAHIHRHDGDGRWTVVAGWAREGRHLDVGTAWTSAGSAIDAAVVENRSIVRIDDYTRATFSLAEDLRALGAHSSVGSAIVTEGRVWGLLAVCSRKGRLAGWTDRYVADFAELVATAVATAEGRRALGRLAAEQSALRRVATLVAKQAPPAEVFAAAAEEAGRLVDGDLTRLLRYEADGSATVLGGCGGFDAFPVGTRVGLEGRNVASLVRASGRPERVDDFTSAGGAFAGRLREAGVRSAVGSPILVGAGIWGVMVVARVRARPLRAGTEERLGSFTDLLATAVSNAQARSELTASRARIVSAADAVQRRIERDLHDGAQRQLVHLGLELHEVEAALEHGPDAVRARLDTVRAGLIAAIDDIREISRGLHPAILDNGGLERALGQLAWRCPMRTEVRIGPLGALPAEVEVAAFYVVSETLANATKHADAQVVQVRVECADGHVRVAISDDGVGGADPGRGSGLVGLSDRVGALGGRVEVVSPGGGGTLVVAEIPVALAGGDAQTGVLSS